MWTEGKARRNARLILWTVGLMTVFFSYSIFQNLQLDYNFEKFFPTDDSETQDFKEHRLRFGSDNDFVLIGIVNKSGIFNTDFTTRLQKMTNELNALTYIDSVISPLNLASPYMEMGGFSTKIYYEPILHVGSTDSLKLDSIPIMSDERFVGSTFSSEKPAISIFLKTSDYLSKDACDLLSEEIPAILDKYDFDETYLAGRSVGQSYYIGLMQSDLAIFVSASMLLLMIFLVIAYRSVWGLVIPMLVVVLSNVWILGIMSVIGEPVNMILTVLPTIIFVVGMSDVVHIVSKYLEELRRGQTKLAAIQVAFKEIGLATLLTSVTTAIGFITLLTSAVEPIRIFGLYTAIGVMVAYVLAFSVLPSVLVLMREPKIVMRKSDIWHKLLRRSFRYVIRKPKLVLAASSVLVAVCVYFTVQIEQNNFLLEDLRDGNEMKQNFLFFEDNFAGVRPFEMNVSVKDTGYDVLDYEVIQELDKLDAYLKRSYGVGSMISPLTLVKSLNMAEWGGMADYYTVPGKKDYAGIRRALRILVNRHKVSITNPDITNKHNEVIKGCLNTSFKGINLLLEEHRDSIRKIVVAGGYNDFVDKYIDTAFQSLRLTGRVADLGSKRFKTLNHDLANFVEDSINGDLIDYQLTGTAHLIDKNNERLSVSMALGLLIAFGLVAIIMGFLFGSFKMVLVALIPNLLPLLIIAGIVGASGVELKVSVSIIFTIAFGIAVDDTIHFMSKIKLERLKGRSMLYALKRAYLSTGRAIIITTLMLCSGFLLLIFSEFLGTFYIGYLISVTLLAAVVADLFLLPALLLAFERKKN